MHLRSVCLKVKEVSAGSAPGYAPLIGGFWVSQQIAPAVATIKRLFPTLTTAQLERIAARGYARDVTRRSALRARRPHGPFFWVTMGRKDAGRPDGD